MEVYIEPDGSASAWCQHASGRAWTSDDLEVGILKKELSVLTVHDL